MNLYESNMHVFYWINNTERYHKMKLTIPIRNQGIKTKVFSFDTYNLS